MSSLIEPAVSPSHSERPHRHSNHPDALFHTVLLVVSVGVIALAVLLRVEGAESVVVPWLNQPLPGVCTYKRWLGLECPGCGLTRCFISLAHGDVSSAWFYNPAGILLFAVTAFQVPFRSFQLWRIRRGVGELRLGGLGWAVFWAIFVSLFMQWIVRFAVP